MRAWRCVPRDPRRPRCGLPLRGPTRRATGDPSLAERSRPRHGAGRRARRSVDAVPADLSWPGPSRRPNDRRTGKELPFFARVRPRIPSGRSGRPSVTPRSRAVALSGPAPASGRRRQLNAVCGFRRCVGACVFPLTLAEDKGLKARPFEQCESTRAAQNLVDGIEVWSQSIPRPSTDRSTAPTRSRGRSNGYRAREGRSPESGPD